MDTTLDSALRELAARQHGVVSRPQARLLGADYRDLRRRLASPDWNEASSQVLVLAGTPETFQQRAMAGILDAGAGATLSFGGGARLWGLPGFERSPIEVLRLRGGTRRSTALAVVHEVSSLPAHHTTVLDGIRVTTGARLLVDLAPVVHPLRLRRTYATARSRRITTGPRFQQVADELCGKGVAGSTVIRELLAERWDDGHYPESGLELRFVDLCARARVPRPRCQVDVGGDAPVGRVDFLFDEILGIAEVNSDLFHRQRPDAEADQRRAAALKAAGYRVVESFEERDVWHEGRDVVARLRAMWTAARQAS